MPVEDSFVRIEALGGDGLSDALGDVARLRTEVFRAWPYLYDGTPAYEREYLAHFATAKDALIVVARAGGTVVGAATAAPLVGHTAEFVPLFAAHGLDPDSIFYCGESVLLPAYRGRGIGHAFFDAREAHARRCVAKNAGPFTHITFCGVVRDTDDPRQPAGYQPLDDFWAKRGYAQVRGLTGSYSWREVGAPTETEKRMQFWMKTL
jgi:GNAT superfamily N-acetyltransferase